MSSIVAKQIVAGALLIMSAIGASAAETPFRVLQDPVLGLRYDVRQTYFDPVPQDVFALCRSLLVSQNVTGHYWVYGKANDAARTYYVIGGYSEDLHPAPGYPRYQKDERGVIAYVQGQTCRVIDPARDVFDDRNYDEISQPMLQKLGDDFAARLVRAFGGANQLRTELRNQRVDQEELPAELRTSMAPYMTR
jgi:hypothetical protein